MANPRNFITGSSSERKLEKRLCRVGDVAGEPHHDHELEGGNANVSFKCRFCSSVSEAGIFSARRNGKKKKKKRTGFSFFNDFLHIRIICHFN